MSTDAPFPPRFLRGLRKGDWLIEGAKGRKAVSAAAFEPDDSTAKDRDDKRAETSINWEDDDKAVAFTSAQPNSQFGVVAVPTEELTRLESRVEIAGTLGHERREANGNGYHGNLLFDVDCPKKYQRLIQNVLALVAGEPVAPPRR